MPKRVIHGEGIWRSDKLARVEPLWVRAEYANLIPLALANGVFECNPRRVWSEVYSYNRTDITVQDVKTVILPALVGVGLLFCWKDEDGKDWGYWPGIEKPGRLPGKSRRGRNEAVGPEPPPDELRKFLESNGIHKLPGSGFGSGFGTGSGLGSGKEDAQALTPSRSAYKGTHLEIRQRQDELLAKAFPWVDRQAEYKRMDSWLEANPNRRPKGHSRFAHNWFQRIEVKPAVKAGKPNGGGKFAAYSRKATAL